MNSNRVLVAVANLLGDVGRARAASNLYDQLARLPDAELVKRGLTREALPSHTFNTAFRGK